MMRLNGLPFSNIILYRQCRLDKNHGEPSLAFADLYINRRYIYSMGKGMQNRDAKALLWDPKYKFWYLSRGGRTPNINFDI